jgi:APA family basic amino acid/polyamine antiporter
MSSRDGLERRLGLVSTASIVVANMIGAGIFTMSGLLMADLGDPWLMLALWTIGGAVALCGALSYGRLGAAMPQAGGEYTFLSRLFHPSLGFLSGWVSLFAGFSAPIAASAIGFAEYASRAAPGLFGGEGLAGEAVLKKALAIVVILAFTLVHLRGLELGARVQNALTLVKVVLVVGLVTWGFIGGNGSLEHLSAHGPGGSTPASWNTMGLSLMWIMFAYAGWNASAYIGSEVREPSRTLPWSLLLGTGVVVLLYLALNLFYLYAVPPGDMAGVIPVAGLAATRAFGEGAGSMVSAVVAFALFSSLSAYVILGPRVYFSMARDGYFFRFASQVSPRFGVPSKSIVLQGALAMVMVMMGTFDQILTYMGFSLGIFPILSVVGTFRLPAPPGGRSLLVDGVAPVVFVVASLVILFLAFFERPAESSIAIGMVLIGIPVFLAFARRRRTGTSVGS